jgi:hypothetical protein
MLKLITILIGCSLTLAPGAWAAKPEDAAKKPKNQKQQVAPKQHQQQVKGPKTHVQKAPNAQVQRNVHTQHVNKPVVTNTTVPKVTKKIDRTAVVNNDAAARVQKHHVAPNTTVVADEKLRKNVKQSEIAKQPKPLEIDNTAPRNPEVAPDQLRRNVKQHPVKPTVVTNNNQQLQANTQRIQKNKLNQQQIQQIQARHRNFKAQRNTSIASAQFNQNYQIRNSQNWSGSNYQVYRSYRPQWHDHSYWRSHYSTLSLIAGGWYFWNAGYWYPAWGYDDGAAYYPYDGPIYSGPSARPFDRVVADVQAVLQEQGYYRGEVDGLLGPLTRQALAEYQSNHGLYVTETIDQPTLRSIGLS